jgi:hypothetical protein
MPRKPNTKTLKKAGKTSSAKYGEHGKRGVPVQVYFSRDAHDDLIDLAAYNDQTVSAFIRDLIIEAAASLPPRRKKKPLDDPRQLRLA